MSDKSYQTYFSNASRNNKLDRNRDNDTPMTSANTTTKPYSINMSHSNGTNSKSANVHPSLLRDEVVKAIASQAVQQAAARLHQQQQQQEPAVLAKKSNVTIENENASDSGKLHLKLVNDNGTIDINATVAAAAAMVAAQKQQNMEAAVHSGLITTSISNAIATSIGNHLKSIEARGGHVSTAPSASNNTNTGQVCQSYILLFS